MAEDMSKLNIPMWAKIFRGDSFSFLSFVGLLVLGSYLSMEASKEESFLLLNPLYCKDPQTSIQLLKKEAEKLSTRAESVRYKNPEEAGQLLARANNMLRIAEQASKK